MSYLYLLFQSTGTTPVDQIKVGMLLEVQHTSDPNKFWIVRIVENVGGRLLLRYEGAKDASNDFWLFYLHYRLKPVDDKKNHKPPKGIHMQIWF